MRNPFLWLALDSYREGIRRGPAEGTLRYAAGVAALNLMLATEYTAGNDMSYRGMSSSSLGQLALDLLATAKEQNPLASQIDAAANAMNAVILP